MNYLLHKQKYPGNVIPIPQGLPELMADISREVLREQPIDILPFLADYLEAMLITRENTIVAEKTIDSVLDCSFRTVEMLTRIGIDREQADKAATIIQTTFRNHFMFCEQEQFDEPFDNRLLLRRLTEECGFTKDEARKAANVIRDAYNQQYYQCEDREIQVCS
jgi:hypothetical protein